MSSIRMIESSLASSKDAWAVSLMPPCADPLTRIISRAPQFHRRFATFLSIDATTRESPYQGTAAPGWISAIWRIFSLHVFMKKTELKKMDVSGTKPEEPASPDAKRRPLKTFTMGDVHASLWARDHVVKGQPRRYFSISFERSYRNSNGKMAYSRSMNPGDLWAVMSLCQQASDYINEVQGLVPATVED